MNSRYWENTVIKLLNLINNVCNFSNNGSKTENRDIKISTLARKHAKHVGTWARKAHWHVSTQDTLARKAREHVFSTQGTLAREHVFST